MSDSSMQAAKAAMTAAAQAVLRGDADAVDRAVAAVEQLQAAMRQQQTDAEAAR